MKTKTLLIATAFAALAMAVGFTSFLRAQESVQEAEVEAPTYIGSLACRKCHGDQHKAWKKTNMAKAFDLLKPGVRADKKTAAGLDPNKDYTRDEKCLPCHVTGWGKLGGYQIPPEGDSPEAVKAQKKAKGLQGVQCEACHGPGSKAAAYKKQNEGYQFADLAAASEGQGIVYPTEDVCKKCHNTDSPFVDAETYVFDFEKRREQGTHTHYRLDSDHACPHEHHVSKRKKKKRKK